ncbi:hypothetical protein ACIQOW_03635 [Kitasatospora sp. NPDC091335]|uniref:hypothetical protein n=1 Tax=Kitasatospora sp. NPDC091335 TaxID=3364085 RepID=UPI00381F5B30
MSTERDTTVDAAAALLLAAITMRDLATAMPPQVYAAMPDDIRNRVDTHDYMTAFDALPQDIQLAARQVVDTNADIRQARRIDAQGRA